MTDAFPLVPVVTIGAVACILLMVLGCTDSIKVPRSNGLMAALGCAGMVALTLILAVA